MHEKNDNQVIAGAKNIRTPLPDAMLYQPNFSPWLASTGGFADTVKQIETYTLVSTDRLWILNSLANQVRSLHGEFWECGVYKGGSAFLLGKITSPAKTLRLFDPFSGMPATDPKRDYHKAGYFADTSLNSVQSRLSDFSNISFHQGFIPDTFAGLEASKIAFAHVNVDIYQSVLDCCAFIYPRLTTGAIVVFNDYGFPSCPGARQAVDQFFANKAETPLVLASGQAIVIKLPHS